MIGVTAIAQNRILFRDGLAIGAWEGGEVRRHGVNVTALEAGNDVGGTWYWNRYPGARFDSESISYGYSFSKELLEEWDWKERFSGQPENLRYLRTKRDRMGHDLAQLEALDNGKPVKLARRVDVPLTAAHIRYFAGWPTRIRNTTCRTVSATSSLSMTGLGRRAKRENSSTIRRISST